MPQAFITQTVIHAVSKLPGFPKLSVLDLSCGEGEILGRLAEAGCQVQGTHYREDDYIVTRRERLATLPIAMGVNLHAPLPFNPSMFDLVLATEVLEHLESHFNIIAEAGRVLKPGGHLIFTTPNIFRMHSRMQFFLTGKHKLIQRRLGWDLQAEERYAYHISPVDFPVVHTLLHQAGLEIQQLRFTRFKVKSIFFLPFWPLVWLACQLTVDRHAKKVKAFGQCERALNRWLTHPAMLFSEQLFVVARRQR